MHQCEWKLLAGADCFDHLEESWREFESNDLIDSPFDSFDFAKACASSFSVSDDIIVAVLTGAAEKTFLPLRVTRHLGVRVAVPVSHPLAQYASIVGEALSANDIKQMMDCFRKAKRFDLLLLRKTRSDRGLGAASGDASVVFSSQSVAPYIHLERFPSFSHYDNSFSSSTRRNRRQRLQKLERDVGKVEFIVSPGVEALASIRLSCAWKREWLAEAGLPSNVLDDGPLEKVLLSCAATEGAWVSTLSVAGKPAAIELGFSSNGHYAAYLGAFDPGLANYSPGQEQMLRTIAWCFERGFKQYDLLAPDNDYKRFWTRETGQVNVADLAFPLNYRGYAYARLHGSGRNWAKSIFDGVPKGVRQGLVQSLKKLNLSR